MRFVVRIDGNGVSFRLTPFCTEQKIDDKEFIKKPVVCRRSRVIKDTELGGLYDECV